MRVQGTAVPQCNAECTASRGDNKQFCQKFLTFTCINKKKSLKKLKHQQTSVHPTLTIKELLDPKDQEREDTQRRGQGQSKANYSGLRRKGGWSSIQPLSTPRLHKPDNRGATKTQARARTETRRQLQQSEVRRRGGAPQQKRVIARERERVSEGGRCVTHL